MSVKTYAQNLVAASRWKPLMHNFVVRICRLFLFDGRDDVDESLFDYGVGEFADWP
jgi:hypothetical protein